MEGWALAYEVTARKWRPQEFDGVIGQEHVTTTLKNAIQAGQIAHAYLFAGPRGVGKTTTARILAKALNCVDGPTVTPCNACTFCQEISEGRSVDVLEIDGASNNRVEQVRTHLLESVKYTPSQGKHKIYIIDEVHMLTKEAFNALLKTLEEPPAHVYFIFATTDPRKVIPTVLSRCQRFDFRRISGPTIVDHLAMISEKSGYDVQREALALIARRVDGSMRDAESLLDQVVAFGGTALTAREAAEVLGIVDQDVYFELLDIVAEQDVPKGLDLVDRIFGQGHDLEEIVLGILEHLRNLLVVKAAPEAEVLIGDAALALDRFREQAGRFETEDLLRLSQLATQMEQAVKNSALPRVQLETGVVRMIRMARSVQLTDVMTRLSEMARRVGTEEGGKVSGTEASSTEASGTEASGTEASEAPSAQPADPSSGSAPPPPPSVAAPSGPAPADDADRSPAASTESSAATPTSTASSESSAGAPASPKLDLQTARNRWPSIVDEIARQPGFLGRQLKEVEIKSFSPPDEEGSGGPATITLGFESGQVFVKERVEKRENSQMIQSVCKEVLGIPVRIECEIDESAEEENAEEINADQKTGDADTRMAGDSSRTVDAEAEIAGGNRSDDAEAEMEGGIDQADIAEAEMEGGIDQADIAGAGLDEYPGSAVEIDSEAQGTTTAGKTGGQAANARTGAAKDPAVQKIVKAFDGQIVTD
ncbi:MAG: DNA polymerase III subunit gamma/tau [Gemmatimonadetes bacterium]|nr:DNA polymerase III subunit gamma/tau [Gemmatimonadota bacterium]MYG84558.1 DNA polymerase III subunit gamma/tau [Gemmatimonadota bacterium]MYJ91313.1 DNA polymerase III subunit gamma/tau [Gemmatimonadota bacterium]